MLLHLVPKVAEVESPFKSESNRVVPVTVIAFGWSSRAGHRLAFKAGVSTRDLSFLDL